MNCRFCNKSFTTKNNCYSHQKICSKNPDKTIIICNICNRTFKHQTSLSRHKSTCKAPIRLKLTARKNKTKTPTIINNTIINNTKVNNYITNNIQNKFIFIGNDFFREMKDKLGDKEALDFIANATATNKPLEIFKELYLNGKRPDEYPIAYADNQFRYYNEAGQMVHDKIGKITKVIADRTQRAMIHGSNALINQCIYRVEQGKLYEIYDIGKIQSNLIECKSGHIDENLKKMVHNTNHPYFIGTSKVIVLNREDR